MKIDVLDHGIFNTIDPRDIQKYLAISGWTNVRHEQGDSVSIWAITVDRNIQYAWVPLNKKHGDFSENIRRLIQTIALVENRSQLEVIEDFSTIGLGDVIRLHSYDRNDRSSNSLPFDDGFLLIKKGKEMLSAAAQSTLEKRAVHPSKRPSSVTNYLRDVRLAQTEQGSFIVKLISPISIFSKNQMSFEDMGFHIPFERKVVVTLLNGLSYLKTVADETFKRGKFYIEPFQEVVEEGVSANLCEAVTDADNERQKYQPLRLSVSWSYAIEEASKDNVPNQIEFSPSVLPYIERAGELLREKNPEKVILYGYVIALKRESIIELGKITIVTTIDRRQKNIHVQLDREAYSAAVQAHDDALQISVEGELIKKGRFTYLEKPRNFQIIESAF